MVLKVQPHAAVFQGDSGRETCMSLAVHLIGAECCGLVCILCIACFEVLTGCNVLLCNKLLRIIQQH